jgi:gliding motility-associated-like protein
MQNWYWGAQCALDFSTATPQVKSHKHKTYTHISTCISDPVTGKLQFFTYGPHLFNESGDTIGSAGIALLSVTDMVVLPLSSLPGQYLLVVNTKLAAKNHQMRAFVVDMNAAGGKGAITGEKVFTDQGPLMNRITAIKHCFMDGYWIVGVAYPYFFKAFYVSASGNISTPVTTAHHVLFPAEAGDMVASGDGKHLLFTSYSDDVSNECRLYEFNSRCGTFNTSFATALPAKEGWTRAHGAAFSPDDKFVYIAYGYMESQLVQYSVADPSVNTLIATSPENFNQMALAPDGRIYITTHISGIPCNKLDVIQSPNLKGTACAYKGDFLRTAGVTNFHIPNFITGWRGTCQANPTFDLRISDNRCEGEKIAFAADLQSGAADSLKWVFNDVNDPGAFSNERSVEHIYSAAGTYKPYLVVWFCGFSDTLHRTIQVDALQKPDLGPDKSFCAGTAVILDPGSNDAKQWLWSTGSTSAVISVAEPGVYSVRVTNGSCTLQDEITIKQYPPIFTALGAEYFICEDDNELVKLDAGEGFNRYKWRPTGDTSQWIIVDQRGEFFVIVEDFRGCKAEDGTVVKSICDMKVWFPSSFTPNDDGLNDVFKGVGENLQSVEILIYNRWGEEVYHSYDLQSGWDGNYLGNHASEGAYVWKARATGYLNKKKVINNYYGTVELLR